jgi:Predicted AAA-ATPase
MFPRNLVYLYKNTDAMQRKKIPIGQSDFKTIIEDKYYYIDKTLYIKDIINANTALLTTRPRRFGKTLNMTMLAYFYDINADNRSLFNGLNIETEEDGKYMEKCGKHPVIFMSFKDLKSLTWKDMYTGFVNNVLRALSPFHKILLGEFSDKEDVQLFNSLFSQAIKATAFQNLLKSASKVISAHYRQKVVILIDEYDTPVIASYTNDYYTEMISLMKDFLGGGFKDNPYLEKGVLTGITRIAFFGLE